LQKHGKSPQNTPEFATMLQKTIEKPAKACITVSTDLQNIVAQMNICYILTTLRKELCTVDV